MSHDHIENVDLQSFNTFGLKVSTSRFVTITSIEEAKALFQSRSFQENKHLILGGGSNVLFTKDFDGLVVKVELRGIEIVNENEDAVTLKVGAEKTGINLSYTVLNETGVALKIFP